MTPALLRLAAHLLAEAATEFANHGCNDFDVSKHLDAEDRATLARAAWEWNGSQPDEDPTEVPGEDWIVMHALARMLKAEADSRTIRTCRHCGYQVAAASDADCPQCGGAP